MKKLGWFFVMVLFGLSSAALTASAQSSVASLSKVEGHVEIKRPNNSKALLGESGMLLFASDMVTTSKSGKATILFRDGSEIRLFESTEFVLEEAKELPANRRSFKYQIMMKIGRMWGKFITGRQETTIRTSVATIGVKGTALRVTDNGKQASIALTEGSVEVSNKNGSFDLKPGYRLNSFTATSPLASHLELIPSRLILQSEKKDLDFSNIEEEVVRISIQLMDTNGHNVKRAGRLYLRSNYYNVEFPENVHLDGNGYTRFPVKLKAPRLDDKSFDGKVVVWATMDDGENSDVGDGNLLFLVKQDSKARKVRMEIE